MVNRSLLRLVLVAQLLIMQSPLGHAHAHDPEHGHDPRPHLHLRSLLFVEQDDHATPTGLNGNDHDHDDDAIYLADLASGPRPSQTRDSDVSGDYLPVVALTTLVARAAPAPIALPPPFHDPTLPVYLHTQRLRL